MKTEAKRQRYKGQEALLERQKAVAAELLKRSKFTKMLTSLERQTELLKRRNFNKAK